MAKKVEIKKEPVKKAAAKKAPAKAPAKKQEPVVVKDAEVVTEEVFEPVKQEEVAPTEQKNEISEAEKHDAWRNEWLSKGN